MCLALAGVLTGCQSAPSVDLGPQLDADGYPRSLVMDSPLQNRLAARMNVAPERAWYAGRKDYSPSAQAGYRLPTIQSSVTYTRDHQSHSHGRIHDHYNSTTYRTEYREVVR